MQLHAGWIAFIQTRVLNCLGCLWFNRNEVGRQFNCEASCLACTLPRFPQSGQFVPSSNPAATAARLLTDVAQAGLAVSCWSGSHCMASAQLLPGACGMRSRAFSLTACGLGSISCPSGALQLTLGSEPLAQVPLKSALQQTVYG